MDSEEITQEKGCKVRFGSKTWQVPSRFINIYSYTALVCVVQFWYSFYLAYTVATLTTLERRYGMPSIYSGIFLASFEIGHLTIIIFSFTETNCHIPRRLAIRGLIMSLGAFFIASTHILVPLTSDAYRTSNVNAEILRNSNGTVLAAPLQCIEPDLVKRTENIFLVKNCTDDEAKLEMALFAKNDSEPVSNGSNEAIWAMIILTLSQAVVATASSTYSVISVLYIDNNVHKDRSSAFIGTVYSMMMLGPAAAFFFSSGVASSIYVHPFDVNPPDVNSSRFVGAWWAGFLLSSAMFLIVSPLFLLFPMKLKDDNNKRCIVTNEKNKSDSAKALLPSFVDPNDENEENTEAEPFTLKTIPRNFLILFKNTVFLAMVFLACAQVYITAGYYTFFPKYIEAQFQQPTWIANLVSGLATAIPCSLGMLLGGVLMAKFKMSQSKALLCALILVTTVAIGLLFMSGLQCEHEGIIGLNLDDNPDTECQGRCKSCPKTLDPVCGSDGHAYASACHAGCRFYNSKNMTYTDCKCVTKLANSTQDGTASPAEECENSLPGRFCQNFFIYISLAFIFSVLIILPTTPLTIVMMRCVGPKYKSWSIGLTSSFCSFLSFIPAPVIFGALFDEQCLLWEKPDSASKAQTASNNHSLSVSPICSSNEEYIMTVKSAEFQQMDGDSTRNCILYNTNSLGIWFHLVTSAFLFISLPSCAYVWWKCREKEKLFASSRPGEEVAAVTDESEIVAATEIEMTLNQRVV